MTVENLILSTAHEHCAYVRTSFRARRVVNPKTLQRALKSRDHAYRRYVRTRRSRTGKIERASWQKHSKVAERLMRKFDRAEILDAATASRNNPAKLWLYVKRATDHHGFPFLKTGNGTFATTDKVCAKFLQRTCLSVTTICTVHCQADGMQLNDFDPNFC